MPPSDYLTLSLPTWEEYLRTCDEIARDPEERNDIIGQSAFLRLPIPLWRDFLLMAMQAHLTCGQIISILAVEGLRSLCERAENRHPLVLDLPESVILCQCGHPGSDHADQIEYCLICGVEKCWNFAEAGPKT